MTGIQERTTGPAPGGRGAPAAPPVAIRARGLRRRYGSVTALDDIDLDIETGSVVGILGPNGAGKTTLVETLLGLRRPDAGSVVIEGRQWDDADPELRRIAAITPQAGALFETSTVLETVELFRSFYPDPEDTDVLLDAVGLQDKRAAKVRTLSGGQHQRLRLAITLAGRTRVVVLDEPTSALDPSAREQLWDAIRARAGTTTVVLTTHLMEEAEAICDRVLLLESGRIVADGSPEQLVRDHGGATTVVVRGLPAEAGLQDVPGVVNARHRASGRRSVWYLTTDDPRAVCARLTARFGPGPDVHQRPTGLGEVFLGLTGHDLAEGNPG